MFFRNMINMIWASVIFVMSGNNTYAGINISEENEMRISIQTQKSFNFRIPEVSQKTNIVLELDARVQYPGVDGYSAPALITLNGKVIGGPRLVNKPLVFQTACGGIDAWYRKDMEKTYAWVLYYGESFEIIGKESKQNKYRPIGVSGSRFAFDVSDIAREENILTIKNLYDARIQKAMGGAELPIIVSNIKITFPEKIIKPAEVKHDLSPVSYVVPRKDWKVNYKFSLDETGGFVASIGSNSFPFTSYFSYPGGGYNTFPGQKGGNEKIWQVSATGADKKYRIKGEGEFYQVVREIRLRDDRIDISDTVRNKSDEDLGVIIKNETDLSGIGVEKLFWGGNEIFLKEGGNGCPENPTLYIPASDGGIGMAAVDDVFRVHHKAYREKNACGLEDDKFALPPHGEWTLEWSIYPTADSDYFTFINAVRRDWNLNSFLNEGWVACDQWRVFLKTELHKIPSILERIHATWPQVKYYWRAPITVPNGDSYIAYYGYPMLKLNEEEIEKYKILVKAIKKELDPRVKVLGYYGPTAFSTYFSVDDESRALFKECRITHPDGEQVYGEGGDPHCPLFFPTEDNDFGRMITKIVDDFLEWGVDGIYFDYFDPSTCGTSYTYNTWDGHTAEIDPVTKTIKRKYAAIDLLACKFQASLIRRIEKRGKVILANRGITTKTINNAAKNIPRLGECGSVSQLPRTQLTPCPLGLQRTHLTEMHAQVLGALDYGMLTYPYDTNYSFSDNPIAKMYPIKVLELHQGYVIGEKKIVTKRSGSFGWGDKSQICCFLYDKEGRLIEDDFSMETKDENTFMKVNLLPGQMAILEKR